MIQTSLRLKYEPDSEPLHIYVKKLFLNWLSENPPVDLKAIHSWILSNLLCARFNLKFSVQESESMRFRYKPASEPLHISGKRLFLNGEMVQESEEAEAASVVRGC